MTRMVSINYRHQNFLSCYGSVQLQDRPLITLTIITGHHCGCSCIFFGLFTWFKVFILWRFSPTSRQVPNNANNHHWAPLWSQLYFLVYLLDLILIFFFFFLLIKQVKLYSIYLLNFFLCTFYYLSKADKWISFLRINNVLLYHHHYLFRY